MNVDPVSSDGAAEPSWLGVGELAAWRSYIKTVVPLLHALDADVAPFGLTHGAYEALACLSEHEGGRLRMCDLAGELGLSAGGLTRRLDGLVRAGLVGRQRCASDGRASWAVLTGAGREVLVKAAPAHVAGVRRRFVDVLSAEELAAIAGALAKVRGALAASAASDAPASV
jgi:DNA-binding MarR family transcriptional regulator